jgi:hypothetical protein
MLNPILSNDLEFSRWTDQVCDDPDIPEEEKAKILAAKIEVEMASVQKVNQMAWFIQRKKDEAKAIRERADQLRAWADSIESRGEWVKACIQRYMMEKGFDSLEATDFKIKFQDNPPSTVIDDESAIPGQYRTVETVVKILKSEIKEAIKAGVEVPGAHLEKSKRLVIK